MSVVISEWPRVKALRLRTVMDRMNLCSCGTANQWEIVFQLLGEAAAHTARGFYRDAWYEFGAKVLDSWELLEHGSGIGWAWLTDDGKLLFEFLKVFGRQPRADGDVDLWPFWVTEFSWGENEKSDDAYGEWMRQQERVN